MRTTVYEVTMTDLHCPDEKSSFGLFMSIDDAQAAIERERRHYSDHFEFDIETKTLYGVSKTAQFVQDLIKYGFRIDLQPTRAWTAGNREQFAAHAEEYAWWSQYVGEAEERVRAAAKQVLE